MANRGFDWASALNPRVLEMKQNQKLNMQKLLIDGLQTGAINPDEAVPALKKLGMDDFVIESYVPTAQRLRLDKFGGGALPKGEDDFELVETSLVGQAPATGGFAGSSLKGRMLQTMARLKAKVQNGQKLDANDMSQLASARYVLEQPVTRFVPGQDGSITSQTITPTIPDALNPLAEQSAVDATKPIKTADIQGVRARSLNKADRELLVTQSGMIDRVNNIKGTFKDDYVGYGLDFIGNAVNWTKGRFGGDSDIATWWQNYQDLVNDVRHEKFGAALTATEKKEFLKAMITPGMKKEVAQNNLQRQQRILRKAMKRRLGSLKAGNYNKLEIDEATKGIVLEDPVKETEGDLNDAEQKELDALRKQQG